MASALDLRSYGQSPKTDLETEFHIAGRQSLAFCNASRRHHQMFSCQEERPRQRMICIASQSYEIRLRMPSRTYRI